MTRRFRLATLAGFFLLMCLSGSAAWAAGPAYEYKVEKSESVSLTGMNFMGTRQKVLDNIERQMASSAKDGWRVISVNMIPIDTRIGAYAFVFVYERQKGGTYVAAPAVPLAASPDPASVAPATPRPIRTPRPPPSNDPCEPSGPCVVESYLGSELEVVIGEDYNVRLRNGEVLGGTIKSGRRLEIELDLGPDGTRTIPSSDISGITRR